MRALHVFEEWADDTCESSRLVAELIEGEQWAWVHERLAQSEAWARDSQAWQDPAVVAKRLDDFASEVQKPGDIDLQWIDKALDAPRPDAHAAPPRFLVTHEFQRPGEICNQQCGALQIIQATHGSPNRHHQVGRELNGLWVAVDAGVHSPWHLYAGKPVGHPNRPYFYSPRRHRTECDGARILLYDSPGAVIAHSELYFEAAVVCIQHHGQPVDHVLKVLRYGWREYGRTPRPAPTSPDGDPVEQEGTSGTFKEIVAFDYPQYLAPAQ